MSTKTTFKRIALVAVAALGLGVLSVAPSSATVSALTVSGVNGTSTLSATSFVSDSTTAATLNVSGLLDTQNDTVTVTFIQKSVPSGSSAVAFAYFMETTTPTSRTQVDSLTGSATYSVPQKPYLGAASADTATAAVAIGSTGFRIGHFSTGYVGAKFALQLDSASARIAGTYTYTAVVKTFSSAGVQSATTLTQDVSIVVAASDATVALTGATAIDAGRTRAWINAGASYTTPNDSAVSVVSTAAATDHAAIRVTTFTAAGDPAPESVTVTVTGPGVVCQSTICGKSIKVIGTAGSTDFTVRADGTAGLSSIVVATTTKTFPAKTVNFFAKAASTFAAPSVARPVIDTTATSDVVRVTATDAGGNAWTGAAYIYATSAASALIAGSETPVACTFDAADNRHECPVTGKGTGTASFKIIDASTVALATATSAEVSVRVSTATAGSVKLAFDKASYVPGERAVITAQVLDTAGLAMPATTLANLFATGAISSNMVLTAVSSNVLTSVSGTVAGANSSSDANNPANAGHVTYVVTMPQTTGTVTLTAKGGSSLAVAGQVAVSASADVVNPSVDAATDAANEATDAANAATDAALAAADAADAATAAAQDASDAVAALSASVSKLISSLRAQITSLTNLVIKIQKKVRA
jgi:trimeric autotransporter adhesin